MYRRARAPGRSWWVLATLAALVAIRPAGCTTEAPPPPALAALLGDVGPEVVVPRLVTFQTRVDALNLAMQAWSDALGAGSGDPERQAAQAAWHDAMAVWQELEVMQIGPAASTLEPGGEGLRDEIYSWPTVNPCRVDEETVAGAWDNPTFFEDTRVNAYGLDAIEYLLFAGPETACPPEAPIVADGTWEALGSESVATSRAAFAVALSAEVGHQAAVLSARWDHFAPDRDFETHQDALNAVFDALFYLEATTRERKLAEPAGLGACAADCAAEAEALPSGTSKDWVAANLRGFRALFTGESGIGIDDLLDDLGHGQLRDDLLAALDDADAAVSALPMSIEAAAVSDPSALLALTDAVRDVTVLLEQDVATALVLEIPDDAAGDAD